MAPSKSFSASKTLKDRQHFRLLFIASFIILSLVAIFWKKASISKQEPRESEPEFHHRFLNLDSILPPFGWILRKIAVPRVPSTTQHFQVRQYIKSHFDSKLWDIEEDSHILSSPINPKTAFTNLIVTLKKSNDQPQRGKRIILAAHYDSKLLNFPQSQSSLSPAQIANLLAENQFIGASDSAWSCALLVAIGKAIEMEIQKKRPSPNLAFNLQIIFFDGEEAFSEWTPTDSLYGSKALAQKWASIPQTPQKSAFNHLSSIEIFILLDLLGNPLASGGPILSSEHRYFPQLIDLEQRLFPQSINIMFHPKQQEDDSNYDIDDDHRPFAELGVPILHLIPRQFPSVWHALEDTIANLDPDVCSRLAIVIYEFTRTILGLGDVNDEVGGVKQAVQYEVGATSCPIIPGKHHRATGMSTEMRDAYVIGNYRRVQELADATKSVAIESETPSNTISTTTQASLLFKSVLRAGGEVPVAIKSISHFPNVTDLQKKSLLLWSKALKSSTASAKNDVVAGLREAVQEAGESEAEEISMIAAEGLLLLNSLEAAFSCLKRIRASNLDCQVLFIEILSRLGRFEEARARLQRMRNISGWSDDARLLLCEISVALHSAHLAAAASAESSLQFGVKDALYSLQEVIQVHGPTSLLLAHLAASYLLLGKFADAQGVLGEAAQLASNQEASDLKANMLTASLLSGNLTGSGANGIINCSVACCKMHRNQCDEEDKGAGHDYVASAVALAGASVPAADASVAAPSTLEAKINGSEKLCALLANDPYLSQQLPVLLARISKSPHGSTTTTTSGLQREQEQRRRVVAVLKEALETDEKIAALYALLQSENIID